MPAWTPARAASGRGTWCRSDAGLAGHAQDGYRDLLGLAGTDTAGPVRLPASHLDGLGPGDESGCPDDPGAGAGLRLIRPGAGLVGGVREVVREVSGGVGGGCDLGYLKCSHTPHCSNVM